MQPEDRVPEDRVPEDPIIELQIKLAHQEDLVETLNDTVYQQGRRIDQLQAMLEKLAEHVRTHIESAQTPLNERPPHY
jgi:SlyX protein